MITIQTIERWLKLLAENERVEFKKAETQYARDKVLEYCAALSNERGGFFVLGITDSNPRQVNGTSAFSSPAELNHIKNYIVERLSFRVEISEIDYYGLRVLVFSVPSRPQGVPVSCEGRYLMRAGESLVEMTKDQLKRIFAEGEKDWLARSALSAISDEDVFKLLDVKTYFERLRLPLPTLEHIRLERLEKDRLIHREEGEWDITNLAAILLAKDLNAFPLDVARKAPRFLVYEGGNKTVTKSDTTGVFGYVIGFEGLVNRVHKDAPGNKLDDGLYRSQVEMFPKQAIRELIANALIHQDFEMTGMSVTIEMYSDRVEISNPGTAPIKTARFIDEYQSRNVELAKIMRALKICEEQGSGIDKVITSVEVARLPAPDFRTDSLRTTVIVFAHLEFDKVSKADRVRACYQHSCLLHVDNKKMSNQSLRERFGLTESKTEITSQIIKHTVDAGFIKLDDPESTSTRYARYLPFWA